MAGDHQITEQSPEGARAIMKVVIVNASPSVYNLAVHRIANYYKAKSNEVHIINGMGLMTPETMNADCYMFSVIFTYDLTTMIPMVNLVKQWGALVEIGGPAATAMPQFIKDNTGITPHIGLDERFEHVPGEYGATFTSRGCPRACEFCLVPRLEGRKLIEYDDFPIPVGGFTGVGNNPYMCDNNILATSWEHQKLVVDKLKDVRNLDLNSGFDDRIFTKQPDKYWELYRDLHLECWRFAYDKPEQRDHIEFCARFLQGKGVDYRHIIVFCLVGFPGQKFSECVERLQFLIDIGTSPYPMRFRPLDSLTKEFTPNGWNVRDTDLLFQYFGVPYIWRTTRWEDYSKSYKKTIKSRSNQSTFL